MSEAPAPQTNTNPGVGENSVACKGPGELGVQLSHLKSQMKALEEDETMPDAKREALRRLYRHKCDKVQMEITLLGHAEKVRAKENELRSASASLEFAGSEAGRKQARQKWAMRAAGRAMGGGTSRYDSAPFPDNPEEHELSRARTRDKEARDRLADAQREMEAASSALASLRLDELKWADAKAEAFRWELAQRWEIITPNELRPAVRALRKAFGDKCWEIEQSTMKLCYAALHPGEKSTSEGSDADSETHRHFLTRLLGIHIRQFLVGSNKPASHIFKAYLGLYEVGMKVVARSVFQEMFEIAKAKTTSLAFHPAEWSKKQVGLLISDEKSIVRFWIKNVCDKQDLTGHPFDDEEHIFWGNWRAPKFIHTQPSGNTPFDQKNAWNREDLAESERLLEGQAERVTTFLMIDLENRVGGAHVEFAKQSDGTFSASRKDHGDTEPDGDDHLHQTVDYQQRRQGVIKKVRNPELFTVLSTADAALYFEVEPRTVYRWISDGKLRAGARRRAITIESVTRFEKARSRKRRSSS